MIDGYITIGKDIENIWYQYTDEPIEYFTKSDFLRKLSIMMNLKNRQYENNYIPFK